MRTYIIHPAGWTQQNKSLKTCDIHVRYVLRRDLNFVVQRQDLRLSGREFQMRGVAEEKDPSPHECRDLGSMRKSMELDQDSWMECKLEVVLNV